MTSFIFIPTADDTSLSFKGERLENLINTINHELTLCSIWPLSNRLSISAEKNDCICVTTRQISNSPKVVRLNYFPLISLARALFLGVNLDCKLSYGDHITNIAAKVSKSVEIMYSLRDCLPKYCLKLLHHSFTLCKYIYKLSVTNY